MRAGIFLIALSFLIGGVTLPSEVYAAKGDCGTSSATCYHKERGTQARKPRAVRTYHAPANHHTKALASTTARTSHGKIKRSATAKHAFERANACPSTGKTSGSCPCYVIDHVQPLCKGGADHPANMQWQTVAAGKAKDRVECKG